MIIRINGYDAWRIRRAQHLEFAEFITVARDPEEMAHGFQIAGEEGTFSFYLRRSASSPEACAFLMHLPGDLKRCGVYPDRPTVCQVYPMQFRHGAVAVREQIRCKPSDWTLAALNVDYWRGLLLNFHFEWDVFGRVVERWNATGAGSVEAFVLYVQRSFDEIDTKCRPFAESGRPSIINEWMRPDPALEAKERRESLLAEIDGICDSYLSSSLPRIAM
jgi:Fe-S-cluster containining protein